MSVRPIVVAVVVVAADNHDYDYYDDDFCVKHTAALIVSRKCIVWMNFVMNRPL
jgi:hypothetical protein